MAKSNAERQRDHRARQKECPARVVAERVYKFLVEFPEQAEKVDRSMRKFAQETRDRQKVA